MHFPIVLPLEVKHSRNCACFIGREFFAENPMATALGYLFPGEHLVSIPIPQ